MRIVYCLGMDDSPPTDSQGRPAPLVLTPAAFYALPTHMFPPAWLGARWRDDFGTAKTPERWVAQIVYACRGCYLFTWRRVRLEE